ncbi:MAG: septum formation initiator family protein [Bdellovibrionales bacterium]|nr:septum formation initiator family protein [Bdellovibrionales bacterium]
MKKISGFIKTYLDQPLWLLVVCFTLVFMHLIFDGTLLRMFHLYNSQKILENRIARIQVKNSLVEERLKRLKSDSRFLEQEVRDRFNLVGEKDIIFIFSDGEQENFKWE